jgi:hypothetical protein
VKFWQICWDRHLRFHLLIFQMTYGSFLANSVLGLPIYKPLPPRTTPHRTKARRGMTAEFITKALGGHRAGATWMTRCRVHEERSLSISSGKDGLAISAADRRRTQAIGDLPSAERPCRLVLTCR